MPRADARCSLPGKSKKVSEDSDDGPQLAALPWEEEEEKENQRTKSLEDNMMPLEHLPVFQVISTLSKRARCLCPALTWRVAVPDSIL